LKALAFHAKLYISKAKEVLEMFEVIKAGVTRQQAAEMFLNDYIVWLAAKGPDSNKTGDIIFVGTSADRWKFTEEHHPPEGYSFHMLRGDNLREFTPIREELPCCSS